MWTKHVQRLDVNVAISDHVLGPELVAHNEVLGLNFRRMTV
jgi:hypothetical protein